MVRSLLNSSLLRRSSGLRFALLFLGGCVVFASVIMWVGMADFDYQFEYEGQIDNPTFHQKTQTTP